MNDYFYLLERRAADCVQPGLVQENSEITENFQFESSATSVLSFLIQSFKQINTFEMNSRY